MSQLSFDQVKASGVSVRTVTRHAGIEYQKAYRGLTGISDTLTQNEWQRLAAVTERFARVSRECADLFGPIRKI